ncbi:MAG: acyl--CoA ligase, partial [Clostridia bacterium]|nr:acyl--CoA ligase [Clostridia bacterium]
MKPYPLNPATRLKTLRELVDWSADQYGQKPAFVYDERKERISVSFQQFQKDVRRLAAYINGLHSENNHIALFGENSYLWIVTYFAITYCGHVVVPLDKDMPKEELPLRLKDSDSDILFLSDTYSDYRDVFAGAQTVLLSEARPVISESKEAYADESAYPSPDASTLASIVFTSGTTGNPKGVL